MNNSPQTFYDTLSASSKYGTKEEWFCELADQLMNKLRLSAGSRKYRITECEFYYNDNDKHKDEHTHGDDQQKTIGELYLNRVGGLDITFGSEPKTYGGILIRGIRNLATDDRFNEVTKITGELIAALGKILPHKSCICLEEAAPEDFNPKKIEQKQFRWDKPVQVKRFNLKPKEIGDFHDKPYRFLVELNKSHKFKDKQNVVETLLASKQIELADVKGILDYIPKGWI